jgi:hypothetical protein
MSRQMANGAQLRLRVERVICTEKEATAYIYPHSDPKRSCTTFGSKLQSAVLPPIDAPYAKKCRSNAAATRTTIKIDIGPQIGEDKVKSCKLHSRSAFKTGGGIRNRALAGLRLRATAMCLTLGAPAHVDCLGVEIVQRRPSRSEGRPLMSYNRPFLTGVVAGNLIASMLPTLRSWLSTKTSAMMRSLRLSPSPGID